MIRPSLEDLLRAAERRSALAEKGAPHTDEALSASTPEAELVERARAQVRVTTARNRLAPAAVVTEFAWHMLLEAFCSDQQAVEPDLDAYARQWQVSRSTVERKIAALVEYDLMRRLPGSDSDRRIPGTDKPTLKLTLTSKGSFLIKATLTQAQ